jgi:ribose transport system permease protein
MNESMRSIHGAASAATAPLQRATAKPRAAAPREPLGDRLTRWRYTYWPDHMLGELLAKRWMETAIPVLVLVLVAFALSRELPNLFSASGLADTGRQAGEIGFIVLGMALVMIVGGIDLSVGSMFALTNFCALYFMHVLQWPVVGAVLVTLLFGAVLGAVNGVLVGYFRLRAFLTTLITLIIYRALYDLLTADYATAIAGGLPDSKLWDFVGGGIWLGVPTVVWAYAAVAIFGHIFLTRLRPGWHVTAIGGSRRSAYNTGIAVRRVVAACYVASGLLTAVGGIFFASRLATAGGDIGVGLEITVLTAAVLGGISLGGGKGSVAKALVGTLIVLLVVNGLTSMGLHGGYNRMVLAGILLLAAVIDIRWLKNKHRIVNKVYVSPAYYAMPPAPSCAPDGGTKWALNDKLRPAQPIGLGRIEGPEDVILDRHDNLYAGSRHGDIIRFFAPDYERMEIFAHIGGTPLGMAFDREDKLFVCIGGMGLYSVTPDRKVEKVTDETNRSYRSINDDSRLRLADDLDITDDGRIFFSEATVRYEMHEWATDGLEARGNGRIICYDTRSGKTHTVISNLIFPNGVCIASDGQSFLFAETWGCTVKRHWFDGPKKGTTELVLDNLPGFPDNINNSSDGHYWMSLVGMRCPALDLAWKMPGFRRRMAKRVPRDEWLFPNINTGNVLKFTENGEILETMWDLGGQNHPMITSMREHRGYLYLGGIMNNRVGRLKLEGADPAWAQYEWRWAKAKRAA